MNDLTFESMIDGKKVRVRLKAENLETERKSDTEYHLAFTQLMQRGIMPKAALEKMMERQGVWTKEAEESLNELQRDLAQMQMDLNDAKTHEQGLAIAQKMGLLRAEALRMVEVKAAVLMNSCEALADAVRRDAYIAYSLVYADTNKPIFKDFDDYLGRCEEQVVIDARRKVLDESIEVFNSSLTGLPEIEYISKVEGEMTSEAKAAHLVDAVEKAVTTNKKKTIRKKKITKKTTARKKKTT
jgi:hypothetical protein